MRWGCCGLGDPRAVPCESRMVNNDNIINNIDNQSTPQPSNTIASGGHIPAKSHGATERTSVSLYPVSNRHQDGGVWAVLSWLLALQSDRCWMHPEPFHSQQQQQQLENSNAQTQAATTSAMLNINPSRSLPKATIIRLHGCDSLFVKDMLLTRSPLLKIGFHGGIGGGELEDDNNSTDIITPSGRCTYDYGVGASITLSTTSSTTVTTIPVEKFVFNQQTSYGNINDNTSTTTAAAGSTGQADVKNNNSKAALVFPASYPCCGGGKMMRGCALDASYLAQIGLLSTTITTEQ